jgi:cytochrome oxidase Cu insertion factor (SCO1/SenC/PrrC family)/thiol-disulfide isomerase/thioredoxin
MNTSMAHRLPLIRILIGRVMPRPYRPEPNYVQRMTRRLVGLRRVVVGLTGLLVLLFWLGGVLAGTAAADGDPGSDVLVSQSLFVPSDAGVAVPQQTQLGDLQDRARAAGFPIRVAIIAHPDDLGAVTALWGNPQSYARFLGVELSLAFKGPLLVVMPNGFGFNWLANAAADRAAQHELAGIRIASGAGLVAATTAALRRLSASEKMRSASPSSGSRPSATSRTANAGTGAATNAQSAPTILSAAEKPVSGSVIVAVMFGLLAVVLLGWLLLRVVVAEVRRLRRAGPGWHWRLPQAAWTLSAVAVLSAAAVVTLVIGPAQGSSSGAVGTLADNPNLDPGQGLYAKPAPNFTLYDQFGRRMTLRQFRGKVVLLAFNDPECTTICPLTTTAMLEAKQLLGAAGSQVQLMGVDANPKATQIQDVVTYSQLHGLTRAWRFGTGTLGQLAPVWSAYHVEADVRSGLISHTPALFAIDPQGRERKLYVTQQSYSAVPQLAQLLAQEISTLLPTQPRVARRLSYGLTRTIAPTVSAKLPREGGGTVRIGPGAARLYVFFDTWDKEVLPIAGDLEALNGYASAAARSGLPALTAIDEASVEPSPSTLSRFVRGLASPLTYPIGLDSTGLVADGYEVQGEPWLVLTSATGNILWYDEPDTQGWPTTGQLERQVRAALDRGPAPPATAAAAQEQLTGSPAPLADLHREASRLLGSESKFAARIATLRGYPIVVNVWASWCKPCRDEFNLLATAAAHYGRSVAFLGVDYNDSAGDAEAFLRQHAVSYPSYQLTGGQLSSLLPGGIQGTPTTIYIDPSGHVSSIHTGAYASQGSLDGDIDTYAATSQ